jgi:carbon storage regulator CsrA
VLRNDPSSKSIQNNNLTTTTIKGFEMRSLQEEVGRLVLSRKVGESINFDGIIKITLSSCKGNIAKLRIEAPRDIKIIRSELVRNEDDDRAA